MALWSAKYMGIIFRSDTDEDEHEVTLESVIYIDINRAEMGGG
jgi:hypothetical protein